jgi:hypothetical protein
MRIVGISCSFALQPAHDAFPASELDIASDTFRQMSICAWCACVDQNRRSRMSKKLRDAEKQRYWQRMIREAAPSGISI